MRYWDRSKIVVGVDEAGRGPLAGPVVVAAVILNPDIKIEGLNDSKKLSEKKREELFEIIRKTAIDWNVQIISSKVIDEINILQATFLGMEKAVKNLEVKPEVCLIDGNQLSEKLKHFAKAIIKGDSQFASIAAASILAKVYRDRIMRKLHEKFPMYNFKKNKGYPTREHLAAISKYGIISAHRKSYRPVREVIDR
ncbi:MAG: ribonuclease HII [Armatimonadetes bacterium]|nr:ribonuclease HII [Armatimonadota bacterium]